VCILSYVTRTTSDIICSSSTCIYIDIDIDIYHTCILSCGTRGNSDILPSSSTCVYICIRIYIYQMNESHDTYMSFILRVRIVICVCTYVYVVMQYSRQFWHYLFFQFLCTRYVYVIHITSQDGHMNECYASVMEHTFIWMSHGTYI